MGRLLAGAGIRTCRTVPGTLALWAGQVVAAARAPQRERQRAGGSHWLFDLVVPFCFAATVGIVAAEVAHRKLLYRWIARRLGTQHYGDEDVRTCLMNSKELDWIFLRDYRYGLVYKGWIQLCSDSGTSRELLLNDVEVFDNVSGVLLYEVPRLYISRDQHEVSVEIVETKPEETNGSQERRNPPP